MGKKLYVGNLSFSVNDDALKAVFSEVGPVESAKVITDRSSGRSKGFGFVEMTTEDDAQKAMSALNGKDVEGRALRVSEARPMAERDSGGGGGRGGGFGGGGGRRGPGGPGGREGRGSFGR